MKGTISTKAAYLGAGAGLVLFAVFGLLPGSFLGGVMGLSLAQAIFGSPLTSGILGRMVVAACMFIGVLVSGIVFVVGSSTLGWLLGVAAEAIAGGKERLAEVKK